jgi:PAS domain S-box-containing protein
LKDAARSAQLDVSYQHEQTTWTALFDNAFDAMFVFDQSGTILSVNSSAETMSGYNGLDLIGQPMRLVFPDAFALDDIGGSPSSWTTSNCGTSRSPIHLIRKDGTDVPSEIIITRSFRAGRIVFVGVLRDVTQRNQVEQTEMQMKAKAEFVAAITHEVRLVS